MDKAEVKDNGNRRWIRWRSRMGQGRVGVQDG